MSRSAILTPAVRQRILAHALDPASMPRTGAQGRLTRKDVESFLAQAQTPPSSNPVSQTEQVNAAYRVEQRSSAPIVVPDGFANGGEEGVERRVFTPYQKQHADLVQKSKKISPHVVTVIEVDLENIARLLKIKENKGSGASEYVPFFVHALTQGIKAAPVLNASIEGDDIVLHPQINVSLGIEGDGRTIYPTLHNAGECSLATLRDKCTQLAHKAKQKKLTAEDFADGTIGMVSMGADFSNTFTTGTLFGGPIIRQPQVAMLGIGRIEKRLVVTADDALALRWCCYVVLSFDHRVVDGLDSGKFLKAFRETLESDPHNFV